MLMKWLWHITTFSLCGFLWLQRLLRYLFHTVKWGGHAWPDLCSPWDGWRGTGYPIKWMPTKRQILWKMDDLGVPPANKKPLFHNFSVIWQPSNRTDHRQADKCEWLREGLKNVRHLVLDEAGHVATTRRESRAADFLRGWPARRVGTLQRAG